MKTAALATILCCAVLIGLMSVSVHSASALAIHGTSTVVASGSSTVTMQDLSKKAATSWPWYLSRSSGLVAAILLLLLALSGIGQLTGFTYRYMEPLMAWSLHRAIAIAFGVSVCIHGLSLLFDKYAPFNIFQIIIPFTSNYIPVKIGGTNFGSLYVALGIFASYIAAALIFTSLYWINTKQRTWRILHYLSYVLIVLVFLHGLFIGTDLMHGPLRLLWWLGGILLIVGIFSRLLRVGTIRKVKHKG